MFWPALLSTWLCRRGEAATPSPMGAVGAMTTGSPLRRSVKNSVSKVGFTNDDETLSPSVSAKIDTHVHTF